MRVPGDTFIGEILETRQGNALRTSVCLPGGRRPTSLRRIPKALMAEL
jgi:hypothetical protein